VDEKYVYIDRSKDIEERTHRIQSLIITDRYKNHSNTYRGSFFSSKDHALEMNSNTDLTSRILQ
jgi:hypothetical protein